MQYFFRGEIDALEVEEAKEGGEVTGVGLKVANNTPNGEEMDGGGFVVSYQYTKDGETNYGNSGQPVPYIADPDHEYEFTFTDPIPEGATGIQYMLVYKGKLGAEEDAVAAKVFEPTPKWSYLFIKQKEFKIGSEASWEWQNSEGSYSRFIASDFIPENNVNEYDDEGSHVFNFVFDLEWAGRWDKITNVIVSMNPYYSPRTFDLSTQDSLHKLEVRIPTKANPVGGIKVFITEKFWGGRSFPHIIITVETEDGAGNINKYVEPVIFSTNYQRSGASIWGVKGVRFESSIYKLDALLHKPYHSHLWTAHYIVEGAEYYGDGTSSSCESDGEGTYNYGDIFRRYKYHSLFCVPKDNLGPLLPFFPYTTATATVRRVWRQDTLRNWGYDTSKFKEWTIPVEYWAVSE